MPATTLHTVIPTTLALRLQSHLLAPAEPRDAKDVVRWFGAIQAQDYRASLWAIGARALGATENDVEGALARREIVRSWALRGTLHIVAADDLRWMLDLSGPRLLQQAAGRLRQLELDDDSLSLSARVLSRCLADGAQLTRSEIYRQWERAGLSSAGQRGYHMLWWNAMHQLICFGSHRDAQPTIVLLDEWLPLPPRITRDRALEMLVLRYLQGHSPVTLRDFIWWAGLTATDGRRAMALAGDQVSAVGDGDAALLSLAAEPPASTEASDPLLLAAFDEYVLGYTMRDTVLDPAHSAAVVPGDNGTFLPTVIESGRVVGTWNRNRIDPDRITLEVSPFTPLTAAGMERLAPAAARYGVFHSRPVEVVTAPAPR